MDDSVSIRTQLKALIERARLAGTVREASSLASARALMEAEAPGVVFLDLVLPDGDGASLVPAIAARDPEARVVLVTALARENAEVVRALGLGACAYLRKPLRFEDFEAVCHDVGLPRNRAVRLDDGDARSAFRGLPPR